VHAEALAVMVAVTADFVFNLWDLEIMPNTVIRKDLQIPTADFVFSRWDLEIIPY
jgi:hypothetical protein